MQSNSSTHQLMNRKVKIYPYNRKLLSLKRNEVIVHVTIWMNLKKNIVASEKAVQTQHTLQFHFISIHCKYIRCNIPSITICNVRKKSIRRKVKKFVFTYSWKEFGYNAGYCTKTVEDL